MHLPLTAKFDLRMLAKAGLTADVINVDHRGGVTLHIDPDHLTQFARQFGDDPSYITRWTAPAQPGRIAPAPTRKVPAHLAAVPPADDAA
jgi:hypothetical protein